MFSQGLCSDSMFPEMWRPVDMGWPQTRMPRVRSLHAYPPFFPLQQLLTKQDSLDIYNERDLFKTEEPATEEEEESAGDGERTLDGELDLPWAPKVRQKDIEHFLEMSRNKFIGFTLGQDTDTLVGLPRPIHESVKTLKQHKYISIADVQIKNEEELEKCPMSLVSQGSPTQEESRRKPVFSVVTEHVCMHSFSILGCNCVPGGRGGTRDAM
uniref:cDNA FLJ50746, moderately similar to Protein FAM40B n=1 Tax=Homo sapiens TaxID=9606 RepID=B7Z7P3_HUMAN|nr:unnamed protein product [Homo sapiens]